MNTTGKDTLASRIKELRLKKNWSGQVLAEKIGVAQGIVSAYERGIKKPSLETFLQLANVLEVSADYLLGRTTEITLTTAEEENTKKTIEPELETPKVMPRSPANVIKSIADINSDLGEIAGLFTNEEAKTAEMLLRLCLENFATDAEVSQEQETA